VPGGKTDDDNIIDRLGRIFKDMPGVHTMSSPGVLSAPTERGQ
jgi:hypothetical protein